MYGYSVYTRHQNAQRLGSKKSKQPITPTNIKSADPSPPSLTSLSTMQSKSRIMRTGISSPTPSATPSLSLPPLPRAPRPRAGAY
ncbi:hypothetical protein BU16DRAFT_68222 [Lophium mytilinum]|uniref:Uncharacterized protein n=1 Tax=Lophium mytilinum TaxID=390894 RepID=A0A6A6QNZ3_9PEZI|nr:hypothetical protein BU16DRAFT_68222 [Lophium mytilinum]